MNTLGEMGLCPDEQSAMTCPHCRKSTHKISFVCMNRDCNRSLIRLHWPSAVICAWIATAILGVAIPHYQRLLPVYIGTVALVVVLMLLRRTSVWWYHLILFAEAFLAVYAFRWYQSLTPFVTGTLYLVAGSGLLLVLTGVGTILFDESSPRIATVAATSAMMSLYTAFLPVPRTVFLVVFATTVLLAAIVATARRGIASPVPLFREYTQLPDLPEGALLPRPIAVILVIAMAVATHVLVAVMFALNQTKIIAEWALRFLVSVAMDMGRIVGSVAELFWDINKALLLRFVVPVCLAAYVAAACFDIGTYFTGIVLRVPSPDPATWLMLLHFPLVLLAITLYIRLITQELFDFLSPAYVPATISLTYAGMMACVLSMGAGMSLWLIGYLGWRTVYFPMHRALAVALALLLVIMAGGMLYTWGSARRQPSRG